MRTLHTALGAVSLSLAVAAAPAHGQEYDRAVRFAGCNVQQTCATATFFMDLVEGTDRAHFWIAADIQWNDGVGGGLWNAAFVSTTPHTIGFWDAISFGNCEYPRGIPVTWCHVRWDPPLAQWISADFEPTAIAFQVGYGTTPILDPVSVAPLRLTAVPEPATVALLGGGLLALGGVGAVRRRLRT